MIRLTCLLLCATPMLALSTTKTVVDPVFRSEGCAIADVNRDGANDVLVGDYWYEAPDWTPREIRPPGAFDWQQGYSTAFYVYAADLNGDEWPDQVVIDTPGQGAAWYENPRGNAGQWPVHPIASNICNETPWFGDLLGDGLPTLVCGDDQSHEMLAYRPSADPAQPWQKAVIGPTGAAGTDRYSHGLGVGDINGDGRQDVVVKQGWWEQPATAFEGPWAWHTVDLGQDAAQMVVADVNGDGRADVLTSSPHNYGLWWHEQHADGNFSEHVIDTAISQTHALHWIDVDGDGQPELITGKRFWVHSGTDPGSLEPAFLTCYRPSVDAGGAVTWQRVDLDHDSGVGMHVAFGDLNGDGKVDLAVSNKKGTAIHVQRTD